MVLVELQKYGVKEFNAYTLGARRVVAVKCSDFVRVKMDIQNIANEVKRKRGRGFKI